MATVYAMSGRNPWMWLIAMGYKKVENRKFSLKADKINAPIAVHVSSTVYGRIERHKYYALPVVQQYLSRDECTRHMDFDQLDAFFEEMCGSILAVIYVSKSVQDAAKARKHCDFTDVPKITAQHWIIDECLMLPKKYENYKGGLGVVLIKDQAALAHLKQFLRTSGKFGFQVQDSDLHVKRRPIRKNQKTGRQLKLKDPFQDMVFFDDSKDWEAQHDPFAQEQAVEHNEEHGDEFDPFVDFV